MDEVEENKERYARIRYLINNHRDLSQMMTREALMWLDDIVPLEYQTSSKPDWEKDV